MRRHIACALLMAALAVAAAACADAVPREPGTAAPEDAATGGPVRIRVVDGVNMDVRDVPLLMAFDELRARGFVVEPTYLAVNTMLADMLARGGAEVAILNHVTAMSAVENGADIRAVSEFTVYTGLVAAPTRIRSCRDLHGRRVAVPNTTGFAPLLFHLMMRAECPGVEAEILVVPEAASRTTALMSGQIDAAMAPADELLKLQVRSPGGFHAIAEAAVRFPDIRVDGLYVRHGWAVEHPGAVRALVSAQLRAHRLVRERPDVLYKEAAERLSLDMATVRAIADAHLSRDIWDPDGGLTPANVKATIEFLIQSGALKSPLGADQVADLSYLDAVLDGIGRAYPAR